MWIEILHQCTCLLWWWTWYGGGNDNYEKLATECKGCIVVVALEKEFILLHYDNPFDHLHDTCSKIRFYRDYMLFVQVDYTKRSIWLVVQDRNWEKMNCKYKFVMLNMK